MIKIRYKQLETKLLQTGISKWRCLGNEVITIFCLLFGDGTCFLIIRYVGLSSTGISYKSGSSALFSGGSFQKIDRYGGFGGSRDGETFKDSFKDREQSSEDRFEPGKFKPRREVSSSTPGSSSKNGSSRYGRFDFYIRLTSCRFWRVFMIHCSWVLFWLRAVQFFFVSLTTKTQLPSYNSSFKQLNLRLYVSQIGYIIIYNCHLKIPNPKYISLACHIVLMSILYIHTFT